MAANDAKREWVERVLDFTFPPENGAGASGSPLVLWNAAKETADAQLRSLSDTLRKTGVPELLEAAGIVDEVLEDYRVDIVKVLVDFDGSSPDARKRSVAQQTVSTAQARLQADKRMLAVDTNPFGVSLSVRRTLDDAFERIQKELLTAGDR